MPEAASDDDAAAEVERLKAELADKGKRWTRQREDPSGRHVLHHLVPHKLPPSPVLQQRQAKLAGTTSKSRPLSLGVPSRRKEKGHSRLS